MTVCEKIVSKLGDKQNKEANHHSIRGIVRLKLHSDSQRARTGVVGQRGMCGDRDGPRAGCTEVICFVDRSNGIMK